MAFSTSLLHTAVLISSIKTGTQVVKLYVLRGSF